MIRVFGNALSVGLFSAVVYQLGENPVPVSDELLFLIAGWVVSWLVDNVPAFKKWFESLTSVNKSWVVRGLLFVVAGLMVYLSCSPITAEYLGRYVILICDKGGVIGVVEAFFLAVLSSQARFQLVTKPGQKDAERKELNEKVDPADKYMGG